MLIRRGSYILHQNRKKRGICLTDEMRFVKAMELIELMFKYFYSFFHIYKNYINTHTDVWNNSSPEDRNYETLSREFLSCSKSLTSLYIYIYIYIYKDVRDLEQDKNSRLKVS